MSSLFLKLFLAHLVGDFVLQPTKWIHNKFTYSYKSIYLYYHIAIHFVLTYVFINFSSISIPIIIAVSHLIIDIVKIEFTRKNLFNKRLLFFIDQLLHLSVLFVVCAIKFQTPLNTIMSFFLTDKALLFVVCLLSVTQVSSVIIKQIISYWELEIENNNNDSLKNAGKYIGILERLLVFGFVITHQISAIGFLIAAKSVFRYNDLSKSKDKKLTEYILIGTLLSFTIAIIIGVVYLYFSEIL